MQLTFAGRWLTGLSARGRRIFMTRAWAVFLVLTAGAASSSCGHVSDVKLEAVFRAHYKDLSEVVAMLQQDSEITAISSDFLDTDHQRYPLVDGHFISLKGQPPITAARLARYQELRKKIGMEGAIFRAGGEVEIDFDLAALGDSRKGFKYLYFPKTLGPLMPGLDHVRKPHATLRGPCLWYKALGPGWYLFVSIT